MLPRLCLTNLHEDLQWPIHPLRFPLFVCLLTFECGWWSTVSYCEDWGSQITSPDWIRRFWRSLTTNPILVFPSVSPLRSWSPSPWRSFVKTLPSSNSFRFETFTQCTFPVLPSTTLHDDLVFRTLEHLSRFNTGTVDLSRFNTDTVVSFTPSAPSENSVTPHYKVLFLWDWW